LLENPSDKTLDRFGQLFERIATFRSLRHRGTDPLTPLDHQAHVREGLHPVLARP
jgi:hypothetical protein